MGAGQGRLVRWVARTGVLLALTLVFQSLKLGQWFTGPLVNAALFVAAAAVGIGGGVFIGAVTPWVALAVGILKPPLAPAVPFIMLSNAVLVIVAGLLWRRTRVGAIAVASVAKFCVLALSVRFLLALNPKVAAALGLPQLFTALVGGVLALLAVALLERARVV
ncbi:MAG TPA: ECF transporter S component [Firmicutes bacterium]|nr:ECF transporter S component [Bacillota bacterium]